LRPFVLLLAALLLVAAGAAAAGCGGSSGSTGAAATGGAGGTPSNGGTLHFAIQAEPYSLDPAVDWEVSGWFVEDNVFSALYRAAPKAGLAGTKLVPELAADMPVISADGTTYTIKLRPDAKFAPPVNRAVTAADFKYSFQRMMADPLCPGSYFYTNVVGAQAFMNKKAKTITGLKVLDPHTIQFKLMSPDLSFPYALSLYFCATVPKEWVAKWGKNVSRHPLGSGPFMFESWTPGQEIVLKKNPNFWNADKVHLDGIDFEYGISPSVALLQLERGQVDILGDGVAPSDVNRMMTDPQWKSYVFSQPLVATYYLFMNMTKKPFNNIKVRQALEWAIDRDKLVKLLGGQGVALWQLYPQNLPGSEPGKVYYGYDPAKAKALLAQAGYPNGFNTVLMSSNVDPMPKLMQSIQADLQAVGVNASIKTMARATYYNIASNATKTQMGMTSWFMDFPDPVDWMALFNTSNAVLNGQNLAQYRDPWVDAAIAAAQKMTDAQARLAKYTEIQQHIMEQAPYIPLYSPKMVTMCGKNVGGFYLNPVLWYDLRDYWLK
jgi:ABC-type transport system substrate-binding protein